MMKRKNLAKKDGFTLVEIIVVLVILAILAAATVPSMIGFVADARGKAYVTDARSGLTAAQAVVSEVVGAGGEITVPGNGIEPGSGDNSTTEAQVTPKDGTAFTVVSSAAFEARTVDIATSGGVFLGVVVDKETYRVKGITYDSPTNYRVIISNSSTIVEKK